MRRRRQASALAAALDLHPTVARLLCLRGFADPDLARQFLHPSLDHLHDPFKLTGMTAAVERLEQAIARRERIAIHGDYDVDGITSTVILRRALEMLGGDVVHFIPERLRDGYGLQPAAIERLHADGVSLIVSVDCGIRGIEAARRARELGVDLIITDHHEPDDELPVAVAVLNPKRHDCSYPDKYLAGVGVALKLVQALCGRAGRSKWLPAFVKIAAIGTLADVVPLVGENRVIARFGLESLSRGPHTIGLRALLDCCGLTGKTIDSYQVAFMLAPRVNAAGRMSTPDIATRLLLATDNALEQEARALAQQLNDENLRRQQEEAELVRGREEGDRDRSRRRRAQRPGRRRRRVASRRHRHRRIEARRHLPQARHRALDRRRRRARLVPQHPGFRHAERARALRRPVRQVRRPPPGGGPDHGGGARARIPPAHQRLGG